MTMKTSIIKICSACLLGVNCRFDGGNKINRKLIELSQKGTLIPICPEQLGGLPTPREIAEIRNGKVYTKSGRDITKRYRQGARETLKIAKLSGAKEAILKQKSPSCGYGQIFDGSFSGKLKAGKGITASLLEKNGLKIISDDNL